MPEAAADAGREPESGDGARFAGLHAFRAAVVACVMAFHVHYSAPPGPTVTDILGHLAYTVAAFCVLSGFLITRPFAAALIRDGIVDTRAYLGNRALRVLPLYIVASAAALLVYPDRRRPSLALASLTFTGTYLDRRPFDLLAPSSWALDNDVWFYISLPLLYLLVLRLAPAPRRLAWLVAGVALAGVASYGFHLAVVMTAGVTFRQGFASNLYRMLPSQYFAFSCGMLMAISHVRWPHARWQPGRVALCVATGLVVLAFGYISLTHVFGAGLLLYALGFTALMAGVVFGGPRSLYSAVLASAPLFYVGEVSYGLYLWHPLVLHVLRDNLHALPRTFVPAMAMVYGVSLVVAVLSYRLVERPALRRKVRWVRPRHQTMQISEKLSPP